MPTQKPNRFVALYNKFEAFNIENLFVRKKPPGPRRTVFVNQDLPQEYWDHQKKRVKPEHVYTTNQVITSKYTIITFLPRNLLEQFRRIANVFFLGIAILQFFPKFSTISPGLVIFPLLVVLAITAAKDGYEDIKRHQSDRRVNYSTVRVLQGGDYSNHNHTRAKTKTFLRGVRDAVPKKRSGNADPEKGTNTGPTSAGQPSDVEFDEESDAQEYGQQQTGFFHHSEAKTPHWKITKWEDVRVGDIVKICDNEPIPADILICSTSEEENEAYVETKNLDGETNLKSRHAVSLLNHLNSAKSCASKENQFVINLDSPDENMYRLNANVRVGEDTAPTDLSMVLLRGTVLRNTAWVIGVVMFTGEDTKIVQNSGGTPSKRSKVERQMNPQVFLNLILLAIMAVVCGIADSLLENYYFPRDAPWTYGATLSDDNPNINGLVTWAFALITFQNIVPISLYISIEGVRTVQAAFIFFDSFIYYEKTKQPTLARSWNLSDDLGQIEYIFSDKTGTLTQNKMVFRQCSIGGKVYIGEPDPEVVDEKPKEKEKKKLSGEESSLSSGSQTTPSSSAPSSAPNSPKPSNQQPSFRSPDLSADITHALHTSSDSPSAGHARALNGFFTVLALCHTVLSSENKETGQIEYKAQSPDEAALVRAAADCGYVFRGRDREILYLQTPMSEERWRARGDKRDESDRYERYELLNILEFTSSRKRMSVILRRLDGNDTRVFLLMKGADNVIFERLKDGVDRALKDQTETHLTEFANEGLRTLTLAYKIVPDEEYTTWAKKYHEATLALDNRDVLTEAVACEIEADMRLLGATAIEDSLQDGVPETIHDLKRAGIKVWVATGDKLETAIAIGHSTNLIGRESNIIVIRGGPDAPRTVYEQLVRAVQEFFSDSNIIDEHNQHAQAANFEDFEVVSPNPDTPGRLRRVNTGMSSVVGSNNGDRPGGFILVIDGAALTDALSDEKHKDLTLRLATHCEGVICCRVSPLQKALVVLLVKQGLGAMTLAIGDGANDVSMIQADTDGSHSKAADVGVGISGEEGLQAVNASDYAIAQFRFLKRLILVHGHWSYARNSNMILNFFYKNIICIGVLWWFQIYCGWSAAYAFEYTYLLFWNAFWTIAPPVVIGLFDRIVDDNVLMDLPELYRFGRENTWFGMKWFLLYILDAVYQSVVIFFFVYYTYRTTTPRIDGYGISLYEMSTPMVLAATMTADLYNGLNTNVWTIWVYFGVYVGIVLVWAYTAIYTLIAPGWFSTPVYGNYDLLFKSTYFYLTLPVTIALCLAPRYIAKYYKFTYKPDDIDIMRYVRKTQPDREDYSKDAFTTGAHLSTMRRQSYHSRRSVDTVRSAHAPANASRPVLPHQSTVSVSASRVDMSTGLRSVHRGFDFNTEEGGVSMRRMQSNLSEVRTGSRRDVGRTLSQKSSLRRMSRVLSVSKALLKRKPPPST
ncbi:hypothetical protein V5O48_011819 [Marasmius crinis-equi]|uniref:Phospholipid-transporting ATPase n=1 Tax=Marasmius crinis-equi TaxID=585013 RepID=A0ABR3F4I0_9AGAR